MSGRLVAGVPANASPEQLINIGPKVAAMLTRIGVTTAGELDDLGAVVAYHQICAATGTSHLMLLYALHGALTGRNVLDLDDATRAALRREAE